MAEFYTLLTPTGLAKITNAQLTASTVNITQVAIGDASGAGYKPTGAETALKREVWRGGITNVNTDADNPNWVVVESVVPATVGGFTIREIALFDADGDMIAIGNYPDAYKPVLADGSTMDLVLRTIIEVSNANSVTMKIDPNVTVASRKFVTEQMADVTEQLAQNESRQDSLLSANATDVINLQNYFGNDQNIHPKVLYFPDGLWGYKYWKAYTPYVFGATETENPCIAVSNDKVNWTVPTGLVNPLEPTPEVGYNNDTHLVYRADLNQLEIWWRYYNTETTKFAIYRRITTDGVNWSEKELLISSDDTSGDILSPAPIFEDEKYKMWSSSGSIIEYRESVNAKNWSAKQTVNINWGGLRAWHLDVIKTELGYEMIVCAYPPGGSNNTADLYYVLQKSDGLFTIPKLILAKNPNPDAFDHQAIYRASFIKENGMYYVFYSAIENNNTKRRGLSLTYGSNIFALNGYKRQRKRQITLAESADGSYNVSGVDSIRISGTTPITIKNLTGGKIGQVIDVILFGSRASAIFEDSDQLITPNREGFTLTAETQGISLICTNEFTNTFRLMGYVAKQKPQSYVRRIDKTDGLAGVTRVNTPFKPDTLTFRAFKHNTPIMSDGVWADGQPHVRYVKVDGNYVYETPYVIYIDGGGFFLRALVENVSSNGFDLVWSVFGTGTFEGTVRVIVTIQ